MHIPTLKKQLDIIVIAHELGIHLDKNHKALCPFHKDKTPSLQFSQKKQIATCFSGNCQAGTMDVIDLVKKYYSWELPQALQWLAPKAGLSLTKAVNTKPTPLPINYPKIFKELQTKYKQSSKANNYLKSRHLENISEIGYNTGKSYPHLKHCIVFPLKNKKGDMVSLYGRSILNKSNHAASRHFYTKNRQGLYPSYPPSNTKHLLITESIIDAATLLQHFLFSQEITVLAAYGTNGITTEHLKAISQLTNLQEITFWFDGDPAGNKAAENYLKQFTKDYPQTILSKVVSPENEDINSLLESYPISQENNILNHLFTQRQKYQDTTLKTQIPTIKKQVPIPEEPLEIQQHYARYQNPYLTIELMGEIETKDLSKLRITAVVHNRQYPEYTPYRDSINLYNETQTEKGIRAIAEKLNIGVSIIRNSINQITSQLEHYRLQSLKTNPKESKKRHPLRILSQQEKNQALALLKDPKLTTILTQKLQATGIVGEQKNALFLFIILLSHKMKHPLHAMVQGTSGSGKSHLIKKIADCMYDQNKIKRFNRMTDKSLYNYGQYDLQHCGFILEDYDALSEEAEFAWRELQSGGELKSSVSQKNEHTGEITTGEKYVYGPIASLVATTRFRIYQDNESRVFVIAIDQSETQTEKVLDYMAKKSAKIITDNQEQQALREIQNIVCHLHSYEVENPYRLVLPKNTQQRRRLTQMLHDFIAQITLLHQYQRQIEQHEKIIKTKIEDLEIAIDLMFESIVLKTDELDGILRQFYEDLKSYIEKKGRNYEFTQREIRQYFKISKTQMHRYITELQELEYITKSSIGKRNTFKYQISYWDNIEKLRQEIKTFLTQQIQKYKALAGQDTELPNAKERLRNALGTVNTLKDNT
jgi:DNA primase